MKEAAALLEKIEELTARVEHLEKHLADSSQTIGCKTCGDKWLYGK